jgi:hypothetical protein
MVYQEFIGYILLKWRPGELWKRIPENHTEVSG